MKTAHQIRIVIRIRQMKYVEQTTKTDTKLIKKTHTHRALGIIRQKNHRETGKDVCGKPKQLDYK